MTTVLDFNSYPQTPIASSDPGTPMSGVSTVAIKDGHEGVRHGHHHQAGSIDSSAAERLARLGGFGNPRMMASGSNGGEGEEYFDWVAGWRAEVSDLLPEQGEEGAGSSSGDIETPKEAPQHSLASPKKRKPRATIPLPPPRVPSSSSGHVPNPPYPTPITPIIQNKAATSPNPLSVPPSSLPGPNNSINSTSTEGNILLTSSSTITSSPASTVTTSSAREEKHHAKMIGPMTYDTGVIDTTLENNSTGGSSGAVLNTEGSSEVRPVGSGARDLDLEQRREGSRKDRLDEWEERIVEGEHGAFRG
ncbi:hypothetical protein BDZ91DRAFT_737571 [Kalaharituber pfeilii]|nr:hypothetical protein BDZ91DRAFT_737571 [Kalaharituber pfeilii]